MQSIFITFFLLISLILDNYELLPNYLIRDTNTSPKIISNQEQSSLTLQELRKFDGFDNISDEEGREILNTCAVLSKLICETFKNKDL